jgi:hypothetical protein
MIKLTRREWNNMKRPIFPDIQVITSENNIQIQTMVEAKSINEEGFTYYVLMALVTKINSLTDLSTFIQEFSEIGINMEILSDIDDSNKKVWKILEE